MNLNFIDREFDRLKHIEGTIEYEYEPKCEMKKGKRNIYYDDLKNDFMNEVNTYGFSPFILKKFESQRRDPNIMRYMNKEFNQGMYNFIKRRDKVHQKVVKQKDKKNTKNNFRKYNGIYLKAKKPKEENKKEFFLQKALKNFSHNKLNISDEEDNMFEDKNIERNNTLPKINNEKKNDLNQKLYEIGEKKILEKFNAKCKEFLNKDNPDLQLSDKQKEEIVEIFLGNEMIGEKEIRTIISHFHTKEIQNRRNLKDELERCKSQKSYYITDINSPRVEKKKKIKIIDNIITPNSNEKRNNNEFLLFARAKKLRKPKELKELK